jgi:methanogenic corrinoid protein MtbC1
MLCGLLRQEGYRIRYLGADVATRFLVDAAQANQPNAILLSVTLETNFVSCQNAIEALRGLASPAQPPVVVGGNIASIRSPDLENWGALPIVDDRDIVAQVAGLLV